SDLEEIDGHVQINLQSGFEDLQVRSKGSKISAQACNKQEKFQKQQVLEIKKSELIDMKNENEIIISRDKLNMYYLYIPISLSIKNKKEEEIISLNSSVRSFITRYNSSENIVEFCNNNFSKLSRLCIRHDKYQS
ncbi:9010_t:CDS:2, partial [Dentiscutata heterogama]